MKRIRRGARIVLIDPESRILLLHFVYREGALAGTEYWGVPGGGLEEGESPEEGARRELREETGLEAGDLGGVRGERDYDFRLMSGEDVVQHDWYFALRVGEGVALSREGFTPEERETMVEARWWGLEELGASGERVVPEGLVAFLEEWPEFEKS